MSDDWEAQFRAAMARKHAMHDELLVNLHAHADEIRALADKCRDHWTYEDGIYRFWHHSFKVFYLQDTTTQIVELLRAVAPNECCDLCGEFLDIINAGTGHTFGLEMNDRWWIGEPRQIVDAFFHAKFFIEMCERALELDEAPTMLPSGWAALLYLYSLR